jgi:AraC-like DNA-binding protein
VITEDRLLDDGAVAISEVACDGSASATASEGEEVARRTQVTIPLGGVYLRVTRRAGRLAATSTDVGDPGSAILFRPGEPYRVSHPIPGHDRSLAITLRDSPRELATAGPTARRVPLHVTIGARQLLRDLRRRRVDSLAAAEGVAALLDAIDWGLGTGADVPRARDARLATAVRLEVAARLAEHLTLPRLGAQVGLSGWELARRFRRATGTSIHAYRTRLRVHAALERIDAGERDLTGLALDLGFFDHSHLTNVIRRQTGLPPSAFRDGPGAGKAVRTILQA